MAFHSHYRDACWRHGGMTAANACHLKRRAATRKPYAWAAHGTTPHLLHYHTHTTATPPPLHLLHTRNKHNGITALAQQHGNQRHAAARCLRHGFTPAAAPACPACWRLRATLHAPHPRSAWPLRWPACRLQWRPLGRRRCLPGAALAAGMRSCVCLSPVALLPLLLTLLLTSACLFLTPVNMCLYLPAIHAHMHTVCLALCNSFHPALQHTLLFLIYICHAFLCLLRLPPSGGAAAHSLLGSDNLRLMALPAHIALPQRIPYQALSALWLLCRAWPSCAAAFSAVCLDGRALNMALLPSTRRATAASPHVLALATCRALPAAARLHASPPSSSPLPAFSCLLSTLPHLPVTGIHGIPPFLCFHLPASHPLPHLPPATSCLPTFLWPSTTYRLNWRRKERALHTKRTHCSGDRARARRSAYRGEDAWQKEERRLLAAAPSCARSAASGCIQGGQTTAPSAGIRGGPSRASLTRLFRYLHARVVQIP